MVRATDGQPHPMKMVLALLMGFIVGLIIALVYRKAFRGVLFSPSFANTLIMLCMITTPVVMCIKSNIALSMGMVGASPSCVSARPSKTRWTRPTCSGA
ncbi:MAG: hypothetical protein ACLS7Z_04850 [Christensenellales bacterium]